MTATRRSATRASPATLRRRRGFALGGYGRQLGRTGDTLGVLIKRIRPDDLSDDEKK